eukprot:GILK01001333.1.p1 GENE.GILK01001333.1~~GILK01001333.1.p1  ORF type:complete len:250 (-),score=34.66 GILK01001333.1:110-817(-)
MSNLFALGHLPSQPAGETRSRREPIIVGEDKTYSLENLCIPSHYEDSLASILIPNGLILDRVEKMARDLRQDYGDAQIYMLCVLKGGQQFYADLINFLKRHHRYNNYTTVPYEADFIRVKSYEGDHSTGEVKISGTDLAGLRGKHVLVVEDIIDTGLTMTKLVAELEKYAPASVRVASLLEKRTDRSCGLYADYVGFSVPDFFVVGYCLDYNEVFRDLDHICIINERGKEKFANH